MNGWESFQGGALWSVGAPIPGDAHGAARRTVPSRPLRGPGGSTPSGQGALPPAGNPPTAALRHAGRRGRLGGGGTLGRRAPAVPAPLPALPARRAAPPPARRGGRGPRPPPRSV